MPAPTVRWTPERSARAEAVLLQTGSIAEACKVLSAEWGVEVTRNILEPHFAKKGKSVAKLANQGRYAGQVVMAPVAPPPPPKPEPPRAWQDYAPVAWEPPKSHKAGKARVAEAKRGIIIPDCHVPYEDRLAFSVMLGILKEWKPHFGVILGDFLDLESLSRHPKVKPDLTKLAAEYYAGNIRLDTIQEQSPATDWTYLEGNHCFRAVTYCNEWGALDGMLSVPEQLYIVPRADGYHRASAVNLRGMRWVPLDQQPYITEHSAYFHGVGFESKHFAASIVADYIPSMCPGKPLFGGHTHRCQQAHSKKLDWYQSCGWLGKEQKPQFRYAKRNNSPAGWVHSVVLQTVVDGWMTYEIVRIVNGRAVFAGRAVTASVGEAA